MTEFVNLVTRSSLYKRGGRITLRGNMKARPMILDPDLQPDPTVKSVKCHREGHGLQFSYGGHRAPRTGEILQLDAYYYNVVEVVEQSAGHWEAKISLAAPLCD